MKLRDSTLAAHAGIPESASGIAPHVEPVYQTSVYDFPTIEASLPALAGEGGHVYARHGVPNSDSLGRAVAALEGAEAGLATSSGMGAIAAAVLSACSAGDRVLVQGDAYGGTTALFERDFARLGIDVEMVDAYDAEALSRGLPGAKLVLVESIANPLLATVDVEVVANACHENGARLVVDNTFATPLGRQPLAQGADLVVHSVTKFLGGHHDLCAGALVGESGWVRAAHGVAARMGLTAAPFTAWLAVRGIRTLDVRMRRAWETAAELATRLRGLGGVRTVYSADRCALVSFDVGSYEAAEHLVASLALITLSPSLGGATTTISHPATSSHRALSEQTRERLGIGPGLLRISVGIENVEDVWSDLSSDQSPL
jgi:cystathionine beta-lyase/cystathionine gamma-synthase